MSDVKGYVYTAPKRETKHNRRHSENILVQRLWDELPSPVPFLPRCRLLTQEAKKDVESRGGVHLTPRYLTEVVSVCKAHSSMTARPLDYTCTTNCPRCCCFQVKYRKGGVEPCLGLSLQIVYTACADSTFSHNHAPNLAFSYDVPIDLHAAVLIRTRGCVGNFGRETISQAIAANLPGTRTVREDVAGVVGEIPGTIVLPAGCLSVEFPDMFKVSREMC